MKVSLISRKDCLHLTAELLFDNYETVVIYVIVFSMLHYGVSCTYNLSMNFSHIWQILDLISFVSCVKVLLSCVICLAASFYRLAKLFFMGIIYQDG